MGKSGVPHGDVLVAYAEAVLAGKKQAIAIARQNTIERLGDDATVDAAAVISAFNVVTRIADATGIPLDPISAPRTASLREELGLNRLSKEHC